MIKIEEDFSMPKSVEFRHLKEKQLFKYASYLSDGQVYVKLSDVGVNAFCFNDFQNYCIGQTVMVVPVRGTLKVSL